MPYPASKSKQKRSKSPHSSENPTKKARKASTAPISKKSISNTNDSPSSSSAPTIVAVTVPTTRNSSRKIPKKTDVPNANRSLSPTLTDPSLKQPTTAEKEGEVTLAQPKNVPNANPSLSPTLTDPSSKQSTTTQQRQEASSSVSQLNTVTNARSKSQSAIPSSIPSSPLSSVSSQLTQTDKDLGDENVRNANASSDTSSSASDVEEEEDEEEATPIEDKLAAMPEYQERLQELLIRKGLHGGKYRCNHCHLIRKSLAKEVENTDWVLDCGCSKQKGVVEAILVEKGIIGKEVNDKGLQSLTEGEWAKLDHIMASLFGYDTTWLLDSKLMKKGLLAAAARL